MARIRNGITRRRCFQWCKWEKPVEDLSRCWRRINLYLFWILCLAAGFNWKRISVQYGHKAKIYFDNLIFRYLFFKIVRFVNLFNSFAKANLRIEGKNIYECFEVQIAENSIVQLTVKQFVVLLNKFKRTALSCHLCESSSL